MKKIIYTLYRLLCIFTSRFRKMPDFIIVGVQKGGTTSLFNYLKTHPEIKLHNNKEIHFFDRYYNQGVSWYRSWFPLEMYGKVTGEATPNYIFYPNAIKRMKTMLPKVKLIVLLRNPIERAYSHYQMEKRKGREGLSFENAIKHEKLILEHEYIKVEEKGEDYFSERLTNNSYLTRGLYAEQLKRLFVYYDKSQVLIIDSKNFKKNTEVVLKEVYDFLELNQVEGSKLEKNKNVHNYPLMNEETKSYLEDFYRKPNEELFKLLNQRFDW